MVSAMENEYWGQQKKYCR